MMDLIERAAAQTELMMKCERYTLARESHGMGHVEWSSDLISVADAMDAIRDLPSVQPEPQWIPVEERLPKQDEMVLITIIRKDERYNKIPFISIGYISWNNTVWWCAHDGDCKSANVEVLAWMPLPEPYGAERRIDE